MIAESEKKRRNKEAVARWRIKNPEKVKQYRKDQLVREKEMRRVYKEYQKTNETV